MIFGKILESKDYRQTKEEKMLMRRHSAVPVLVVALLVGLVIGWTVGPVAGVTCPH